MSAMACAVSGMLSAAALISTNAVITGLSSLSVHPAYEGQRQTSGSGGGAQHVLTQFGHHVGGEEHLREPAHGRLFGVLPRDQVDHPGQVRLVDWASRQT